MKFFDRLRGLFAPAGSREERSRHKAQLAHEAAIERRLEAATQEAYRWARIDRRTKDFQPLNRSADAAISESYNLMHSRIRSECLNNAQFKRIVEALCDLVVGTGIQTFSSPFDPWEDFSDIAVLEAGLRFALESDDLFEQWFEEPKQFDVAGKLSGPEAQRLALSENAQTGDCLLLRCWRDEPGRVSPLCYQTLEREQLDTSQDRPAGPGQNKIITGIELDAFGREIAFYIYDAHPYEESGYSRSTRVPASRVVHLFSITRPSQNVGVTWLHAIGQNNFDRDRFISTELASAAKAALLCLIAKREHPYKSTLGLSDGETDTDNLGNEEIKLGTDPLAIEVGMEEDVSIIESTRPNATAGPFIDILDHDTAGGVGLSYYTMTGRFDKTNYTGFRGALIIEDQHLRPIQNWLGRNLVLPIRREFNALAAARGDLRAIKPSEFVRNQRRYQRFDAIGPGRELLDPENETNAAVGKLRSGLTTLKIECARRGLHWIKVLRQIAMENAVANSLGIVLDFSKGQGGQVDRNTRSTGKANAETE